MTAVPPGWIANPDDPTEVQYWDGSKWTGAFQRWNGTEWVSAATPAAPVRAPKPPLTPKQRRLRRIIAISAGSLVVLLIATIAIVNVVGAANDPTTITSRPIVRTDERAGYDYTAPVTDIEDHDIDFVFKSDIRPENAPAWVAEEGGNPGSDSWAFEVFANKELTIGVPTTVFYAYNVNSIMISSYETRYAAPYDISLEGAKVIRSTPVIDHDGEVVNERVTASDLAQGSYTQGGWGLYEQYFLVRYIDAQGNKLERPVVSEFSFAEGLETPAATIVADDTRAGAAKFTWEPIEGASTYVVVKSFVDGAALEQWDGDLVSRDYIAIAETSETSWSTALQEFDRFGNPVRTEYDPYLTTQNDAMEMFSTSDDEYLADSLDRPLDHAQIEYGVIAIAADGTTSAFGRASVASGVASLPYELAGETLLSIAQCGDALPFASRCGSPDQVITYVPYVGLDGSVRVTPAHMNDEPWLIREDGTYVAAIIGEGTDLGYWASFPAGSTEEFAAAAAAFNERSALAAPQTGLVETQLAGLTTVAEPESDYSEESADRANGSNELVLYIAAHMIDGHEAIDMAEWDDWGSVNIRDAAEEAYWQNPIAGVTGYDVSFTDDLVVVAYEENREARVAETQQEIDRIVGEILTDGMSETEKVTAINDYLADTIEYDYDAMNSVLFSYIPDDFKYAWTLSGALLDRKVVCVGYAQAFSALADAADLESVVVTGAVISSAVGHAWNKVEVDGQWYAVDPTWNDGPDRTKYLLISDSEFVGDAAREAGLDWVYDTYAGTYATQ